MGDADHAAVATAPVHIRHGAAQRGNCGDGVLHVVVRLPGVLSVGVDVIGHRLNVE